MGKDLIQTIFSRRSIRKYTGEPVSEADIKTLLEAAMAAPSASNNKPWHFVVVTQRETLDALADAHPYGKMLASPCAAILVSPITGSRIAPPPRRTCCWRLQRWGWARCGWGCIRGTTA
jgi:nitroreductase